MWHACATNGMIASYIGVEVSSEVSVPLAQKQSFQSLSMRSPTREAIGVVCLRSFGVDETVARVLVPVGACKGLNKGENNFTSAALGVWRRWEYLQRSFLSFSIRVARVSYIGVPA